MGQRAARTSARQWSDGPVDHALFADVTEGSYDAWQSFIIENPGVNFAVLVEVMGRLLAEAVDVIAIDDLVASAQELAGRRRRRL